MHMAAACHLDGSCPARTGLDSTLIEGRTRATRGPPAECRQRYHFFQVTSRGMRSRQEKTEVDRAGREERKREEEAKREAPEERCLRLVLLP